MTIFQLILGTLQFKEQIRQLLYFLLMEKSFFITKEKKLKGNNILILYRNYNKISYKMRSLRFHYENNIFIDFAEFKFSSEDLILETVFKNMRICDSNIDQYYNCFNDYYQAYLAHKNKI